MTTEQIWQAVLAELELTLSKANFTTWFKNTFIGSYDNEEVVVCVPGMFYKSWLEGKFHSQLIKLIEKVSSRQVRSLTYRVETRRQTISIPVSELSNQEKTQIDTIASSNKSSSLNSFGLNPRYIFDNFVVGKGNELAHAAAQAIVARPGQAYNPLFIYGGSGLGKTHILQAIGNQLLRSGAVKKVVYTTCEKFANEFISSVRPANFDKDKEKPKMFQDSYRHTDVLLIDDIQFISGKEQTQEAFFHTFNTLHQLDKQIVITSDRPPKAIKGLEERLLTRFEMGMIADVIAPEFETRVAILQQKCLEKNFLLEQPLLFLIASLVKNNVRELEGALNKIYAYFQLKQTQPNEDVVRGLIANLENSASNKVVTPKIIIQVVSEFYDIKLDEILSPKRDKRLSHPRQIIMFLMREEIKCSFPAIGAELGGRDHTTAMHACKKIKFDVEKNYKIREEVNQIRQRLYHPV